VSLFQAYNSTTGSKPPKIIRLPSKGIGGLPRVQGSMPGSSIIFFMPASRVALSGPSIYEKANRDHETVDVGHVVVTPVGVLLSARAFGRFDIPSTNNEPRNRHR
jgi:hypothetical protein